MESTVVTINQVDLPIKKWNNKIIVTLQDVDRVHKSSEGTARKNFNRNKNHFIENEDYFSITRKEFTERQNSCVTNSHASKMLGNPYVKMILLTETGYLMIAKSLNDDLAWDVQRKLVNSYFKLKEVSYNISEDLPINLHSVNQVIQDLNNNFIIMCNQMDKMENVFDKQFLEFKGAIDKLQYLLPTNNIKENNNLVNKVVDPIRDIIRPLAELYNDNSKGYNNTYRKVYATMDVDWKNRQSRYQNKKGNKNKPSKILLLESDKKLLSMFHSTVNKMIKATIEV